MLDASYIQKTPWSVAKHKFLIKKALGLKRPEYLSLKNQ